MAEGEKGGECPDREDGRAERREDQQLKRASSNEKGEMCREREQEEQDLVENIESTGKGGDPLLLVTEVTITRTGPGEVASGNEERKVERLHDMPATSAFAASEGE